MATPASTNFRGSLRVISKRVDSLFHGTGLKDGDTEEEDMVPEAKIDIAFVGVEHSGKSTVFKQITSAYTPEDFRLLVLSDGRSQAIGTLLKITLTLLKPIYEELDTLESKDAAEELLNSLTMYNIDKKAAKALKVVWSDPVFLASYRNSPFFQPIDFLADVANCEQLIEEDFVVPKKLHLKLHNATHGYNSTKFSFQSEIPIDEEKGEVDSHGVLRNNQKNLKRNSENEKSSSENSEIMRVPSHVTPQTLKARKPRGSIVQVAGAVASRTRHLRQNMSRNLRITKSQAESTVKTQKRNNEVRIWDLGGLFERRTDWEYFLRRSNVALFFCSLSDYSTVADDGSEENLLQDALNMFQVLCESDFLKDRIIQVVFTKKDVFEQKLQRFKIPLNQSGLFKDAPSGKQEFDVNANIEFIQEKFLERTETKNSFLTRDNISFKRINAFDEFSVKEFFLDCIHSVKAVVKTQFEKEMEMQRKSMETENLIERLQKEAKEKQNQRSTRGFSFSSFKGFKRKSRKRAKTNPHQQSNGPKAMYTNNHQVRKSKRISRKVKSKPKPKA